MSTTTCRPNCGACCIAPSITSPLPGMPNGKAAGEYCVNLNPTDLTCRIWGTPEYPPFCRGFSPSQENCGNSREEALVQLGYLERATAPAKAVIPAQ